VPESDVKVTDTPDNGLHWSSVINTLAVAEPSTDTDAGSTDTAEPPVEPSGQVIGPLAGAPAVNVTCAGEPSTTGIVSVAADTPTVSAFVSVTGVVAVPSEPVVNVTDDCPPNRAVPESDVKVTDTPDNGLHWSSVINTLAVAEPSTDTEAGSTETDEPPVEPSGQVIGPLAGAPAVNVTCAGEPDTDAIVGVEADTGTVSATTSVKVTAATPSSPVTADTCDNTPLVPEPRPNETDTPDTGLHRSSVINADTADDEPTGTDAGSADKSVPPVEPSGPVIGPLTGAPAVNAT
jgi:hypothetical protein